MGKEYTRTIEPMSHKRRPGETWQHIKWMWINVLAGVFTIIVSKWFLSVIYRRLIQRLAQSPQRKRVSIEGSPHVICFYPFIFQTWKPETREGKGLAHGHIADECHTWDENSGAHTRASATKCHLASFALSNVCTQMALTANLWEHPQ